MFQLLLVVVLTIYFLVVLFGILFFRPEGTRMIQIMLLKSLVQVCGRPCIRRSSPKWTTRSAKNKKALSFR